jgi:hypothetical protein
MKYFCIPLAICILGFLIFLGCILWHRKKSKQILEKFESISKILEEKEAMTERQKNDKTVCRIIEKESHCKDNDMCEWVGGSCFNKKTKAK